MAEPKRWVARAVFVLAAAALAWAGYVQGVNPVPLLPWRVREAAFAMVTFTAFVLVSGGLFVRRLRRREGTPAPLDATVTAIVPTYRDAGVLHHSVETLLRGSHPVRVAVVCEPDDEAGIERARALAAGDDRVSVLVNDRPGSKAGAVNDAVAQSDADCFALFDADQRVPADLFERVSGHLRDHDIVQVRFVPRPTGVVETLAYYEYLLFNYCFRQPLYALTTFRMATSKALLFSREAFERVGGYDETVVAEDYEFGHRCYLAGLDVKLCYGEVVSEESVHSLADWWGQRKRWMTGNAQVLHRLLGLAPSNYRSVRTYVSLAIGVLGVGGSVFLLALVPKAVYLASVGDYALAAAPLVAIYLVALLVRVADAGAADRPGLAWLLIPFVLPFFSFITLMAVLDYLFAFDGEWYTVEKGG